MKSKRRVSRHIARAAPRAAAAALFLAASAAHAEPAIWLVQGTTARVYLFGTMHILPRQRLWLAGKIQNAFAKSDELWEEADIGLQGTNTPDIMARAVAPDQDLWKMLPPATAAKFREQLRNCDLPDDVVAHFRPWFASKLPAICELTGMSGGHMTNAANGPEGTLLAEARAAHMQVRFFETAQEQIGYLADAPASVQLKQLRDAIDEQADDGEDFKDMESAWLKGDVPSIAKFITDMRRSDLDTYVTIYTKRNERFAAKIAALLQSRTTAFVAIGAGHLAGPDAVQVQLEKMGIASKRL